MRDKIFSNNIQFSLHEDYEKQFSLQEDYEKQFLWF